jgi:tRNA dimethylallyltransferase
MGKRSRTGAVVVLLAGPTASGKSHLALDIAARRDGVIVNADSMQVYRDLRILTARPAVGDESVAPHRLYGHVAAATRYSVGAWLADVAGVLREARAAARTVIVVGGTGLYFRALTDGLAAIPAVPPALRADLLAQTAGVDSPELHARLASIDPEDAATIRPSDRTRIVRALEVFVVTGTSLAAWKKTAAAPPLIAPAAAERIVLTLDRAELHRRIGARAEQMVRGGAVEEVRGLLSLGLDPDLPAMKAIGARELRDHIAGKTSLEEATTAIKTETRRYAKRQMTWFRNQMGGWRAVDAGSALDLRGRPA